MRRSFLIISAAVLLLAAFCLRSQAGDYIAITQPPKERDLRRAKLYQMAVLVHGLAQGKSRLMTKTAACANPGSGRFMRSLDDAEAQLSMLTVYPVSTPINTRLPIGLLRKYGRILGAVEVLTPVRGAEDKDNVKSDVYLLFMPINGPAASEMPIWLVSMTVGDDGRVTYADVAHSIAKLTRGDTASDTRSPSVTASINFLTADIGMTWSTQTYSFKLTMEIFYA